MFVSLVLMSVTFSDGRGRASAMADEMTLTLGGAHVGVVQLREASGTDFCSFCCIRLDFYWFHSLFISKSLGVNLFEFNSHQPCMHFDVGLTSKVSSDSDALQTRPVY